MFSCSVSERMPTKFTCQNFEEIWTFFLVNEMYWRIVRYSYTVRSPMKLYVTSGSRLELL
jgi:hypothetical protein